MTNPVDRILVITLSNIGDAIMTTPVLEALHQRYPVAVIDLVADRRSSAIFSHCPYRGRIIHREKRYGWRGTLRLIHEIRQTRYDLIVDLRTDGAAYVLRARKRVCKWFREPRGVHAVEQHMGVLKPLGISDIPPTRLWFSEQHAARARVLLQDLPGRRWLALGPGANWAPKIWPADNYQALANSLSEDFDAVILLGNEDDQSRCTRIASELRLPSVNLAGKTDLLEVGAVLACAHVFVGNDSGLGHIAAAVGTATVTLFGPGEPEQYHPWGERARWLAQADNDIAQLDIKAVAELVAEFI